MRFSHFFIDRPIFASVIAIVITLVGAIAYFALPVAQYPEIVPPTIQVSATYPGASAETIADTVASPIEQEINGVEGMLFLQSSSTGDGRLTISVTFELGTDLDIAQVLVQNRVAVAEPRLPEDVRRLGINVVKNTPDMLMVVHLFSPDGSRDTTYLSNYARTQIVDRLARLEGVGQYNIFGERAYAMRIWIDPERAAALDLTARDIVDAVRANNVQVASGSINQLPIPKAAAFEIPVESQGRFLEPAQFGEIVVKRTAEGRVTRLSEVARIELGAQDYSTIGYLDGKIALPVPVYQRPGSNALETAASIEALLEEIKLSFPSGIAATIAFNPTNFIQQSVDEVYFTIFEAMILVVIVILLFLQSWRAAIIPIVAIPIALIGTGLGDRHPDRPGDRRGREHRALFAHRHVAARGGAQNDGRSRWRADRHRTRADGGVRANRVYYGYFRRVLPAVCVNGRDRNRDLGADLAHPVAGARRAAAKSP